MEHEDQISSSSSSSTQNNFFLRWLYLQQEDLTDLLQTLNSPEDDDLNKEDSQSRLIEKNIHHFNDYIEERSQFCKNRASDLFSPRWCSSLENSLLWIGGCRPSLFIRLIYAVTSSEFESQLCHNLQTGEETSLSKGLSSSQLIKLDELRRRTTKEEDKLTLSLASLQEEIVEEPFAMITKKSTRVCEIDGDPQKALDEHQKAMGSSVEKADKLRMSVLKEVLEILTTSQALAFLATGKKLHLCMHEWGKMRDEMRK